MGTLKGKTALVTGSSRGIGRATAIRLGRDGALVAVHYATNADAAKQIEQGNDLIAPILEAGTKAYGTPFTGAWGDTQLALVNVVVQSIPGLSAGKVSSSDLEAKLKAAQETAQNSLNKAK